MRFPLFIAALALPGAAIAKPAPITGHWITDKAKAVVHIAPCGPAMCGTIAKLLRPPKQGPVDINNRDPALRTRTLLGMRILYDLSADGDAWQGRVYDPKSGKSYKSLVRRNADGTLEVKGCIAFFCKTQTWTAA